MKKEMKSSTMKRAMMVSAVMVTTMMGTAHARQYGDYNNEFRETLDSAEFMNINICKPFKEAKQSINDEISELDNSPLLKKISNLEKKISERQSSISSYKKSILSLKNSITSKKRRLTQLENNFDQMIDDLEAQEASQTAKLEKLQEELQKLRERRDNANYISRIRYNSKISDKKDDIKKQKKKIVATQKELADLPKELASLPNGIQKLERNLSETEAKLAETEGLKPSLANMAKQLEKAEAENDALVTQKKELKKELKLATLSLSKCRYMQEVTNAYPIMLKQMEDFKEKPESCDMIDSMLNYVNTKAEKRALEDAHMAICSWDVTFESEEVHCEESSSTLPVPSMPEEKTITVYSKIQSPMDVDGEYPSNFREGRGVPMSLGTIGGEYNTKSMRFSFEYDIESPSSTGVVYDYILIVDANGNEIAKLSGNGVFESDWIATSSVEFFFYSDGRYEGKGFELGEVEMKIFE